MYTTSIDIVRNEKKLWILFLWVKKRSLGRKSGLFGVGMVKWNLIALFDGRWGKKKHVSGGTPASFYRSGQQWDFPNAWPPLQSMLALGLWRTNYPEAQKLGEQLATTWLRANYYGFVKYNQMFEKVRETMSLLGNWDEKCSLCWYRRWCRLKWQFFICMNLVIPKIMKNGKNIPFL